ncbi:hypothetical protein SAMN06295912_11852 [Sphingomonas laterariae]|uniref:Lipoprotein n=2 Tax=Edaphosphingomonas laterariae TaxID=861865 RepID=A0A239HSH2_9SPHN|nr:hypothetical protein SAMN06295912_11852 [Sphingomonas laterariae]
MGVNGNKSMGRWRKSIIVAVLLAAACTGEPDAKTSALLASYENPMTLTGNCQWTDAKVGPPMSIRGSLEYGDEHFPDHFVVAAESKFPTRSQLGFLPFVFKKGKPVADFGTPLLVSARIVTGSLRCSGSFPTGPFEKVLLIDAAQEAAP